MDRDEQQWADAIEASPEDFVLYSVFADWLEEQGRADAAYGWRKLAKWERLPSERYSNGYYWLHDILPSIVERRLLSRGAFPSIYLALYAAAMAWYQVDHSISLRRRIKQ